MMISAVNELLTHIREVEEDTIRLSQDSITMLSQFIEKNGIELDEDAAKAFQYQDIISQQLSATIDAINSVKKSIDIFENAYKSDEKIANDSLNKLHVKLKDALLLAQNKRESFSGNLNKKDEDEIEFF